MAFIRERLINKTAKDKKQFHCQIKSVDSTTRTIEGFASTKFKDRANDVVDPAAFDSKTMGLYMENPIILLQHDTDRSIGKLVDFRVVTDGLFVKIQIGEGFDDADETWARIEQEILRAFSIGFYPTEWDYDQSQDAYVIRKLELCEISVVSIPCNRESLFSVSKAFRDGDDLVCVPDKAKIAVIEIKKHLSFLKNIYATLPTETKIDIDLLQKEFENIFNLDEKASLLKEIEASSRGILIDAILEGQSLG